MTNEKFERTKREFRKACATLSRHILHKQVNDLVKLHEITAEQASQLWRIIEAGNSW